MYGKVPVILYHFLPALTSLDWQCIAERLEMVNLLNVGAIRVLELFFAVDDSRHGREVALASVCIIQHFLTLF